MRLTNFIEILFRKFLPSPFTIAILLTIVSIILALTLTDTKFYTILNNWEEGLWNPKLMTFTTQMILMLVLGYVLGLTQFANKIISKITKLCYDNAYSAAVVSFFSILVSLLNWGLGLIFGAILARKVAEYNSEKNIEINYPLIGAAGYSGLMVWHGGLSGSAPLKIAEKGHFKDIIYDDEFIDDSWNGLWYSSVQSLESGWSIEYKIPFNILRFSISENKTWGLDFIRYIKKTMFTICVSKYI